jgi:hypothetical protein
MITLQDNRVLFDGAATPESRLERLQPCRQRRRLKTQLVDHRDFLAATAAALQAHDGPRWTR